jgi:hypothetical protein
MKWATTTLTRAAAQQNLAEPYNGALSRLNNASFSAKSHTSGGDIGF